MHATVQNWSRRVTKRLTVEDGPIHGDTVARIQVDAIHLEYTDNGSGLNVKASLHGPVLREDGTPHPNRRVMHIVWNVLAEGGWLRELIDEHTPTDYLRTTDMTADPDVPGLERVVFAVWGDPA